MAEGLYNRRFGSKMDDKPPCYGDVMTFDPEDPECKNCPVKASCRYHVETKIADSERRSGGQVAPTATAPVVRPGYAAPVAQAVAVAATATAAATTRPTTAINPPTEAQRQAAGQEDTFLGVLAHNAFLSGVESVLTEAVYAARSIPRRRYPDPFRRSR